MNYGELFTRLSYETALVSFFKRDGSVRCMLSTRNLNTSALEHGNLGGLLNGHDNRCNIRNKNLAVVDLILGECRSFNSDRVIRIDWYGEITTQEDFDRVIKKFMETKREIENTAEQSTLDLLTEQ